MALSADDVDLINNASEGNLSEVRRLLLAGANVNARRDSDGETALAEASFNGCVDVVRLLLQDDNVDVNARTQCGDTALIRASFRGKSEVVRELLRHDKVDVNAKDNMGGTALYWASFQGLVEVVRLLLLKNEVDVNIRADDGTTALDAAVAENKPEIITLLLDHDKFRTNYATRALYIASQEGHVEFVRELLQRDDVDVNALDPHDGATALLKASHQGHVDVVRMLLQKNEVDVNIRNKDGTTALHAAIANYNPETISLLLDHDDLDVNAQDADGDTALHIASAQRRVDIVKMLLQHKKVNATLKNNNGETARDIGIYDNAIEREFHVFEFPSWRVDFDRRKLEMAMTFIDAPVELSFQYIKSCMTKCELGSGAFGKVYLAEDNDLYQRKQFAVKMINLSPSSYGHNEDNLESFQRELSALKRFRHPNIIVLYGYNFKGSAGEQFLVLEYAAKGSLDGFLKDNDMRARLPAATRLSIMYQVARAINCLHTGAAGWKVYHRDIKSANICLTEDFTPRLIDCGVAKFVEDEFNACPSDTIKQTGSMPGRLHGSRGYMCPEYIVKIAQQMEFDFIPAYDVFSFGIVMAELIIGRLHDGKQTKVYQKYVLNGNTPVVDGWEQLKNDADRQADWDPGALEVVCKTAIGCITPTSEGRLSTDQIIPLLHCAISKNAGESDVENMTDLLSKLIPFSTGEGNSKPEGAATGLCVLCTLCDSVVNCKGRETHPLCADCIDDALMNTHPSTTGDFQLSCPMLRCSSQPFTLKDLKRYINSNVLIIHENKKHEQRDNEAMELQRSTNQVAVKILDGQEQFSSVIDRLLPGWALQNAIAERFKLCPTVVVITRIKADRSKDLKTWFKNGKERKYNVVFYCEHSGDPGHESFEISVNREWIVKAAPWLRFAINIAAAWDPSKVIGAAKSECPFLNDSKEMKDLIKALGDEGKPDKTQVLETGALQALADMANKKENSAKWKESMVAVVGENGRTKWVKKEFEKKYGASAKRRVHNSTSTPSTTGDHVEVTSEIH